MFLLVLPPGPWVPISLHLALLLLPRYLQYYIFPLGHNFKYEYTFFSNFYIPRNNFLTITGTHINVCLKENKSRRSSALKRTFRKFTSAPNDLKWPWTLQFKSSPANILTVPTCLISLWFAISKIFVICHFTQWRQCYILFFSIFEILNFTNPKGNLFMDLSKRTAVKSLVQKYSIISVENRHMKSVFSQNMLGFVPNDPKMTLSVKNLKIPLICWTTSPQN